MIKIVAIVLVGVSLSGYAQDEVIPVPSSLVKTQSGLCNNPSSNFQGSGTVFRREGHTYVLTSEHSVLHGQDRICHTVINSKKEVTTATFLTADAGEGVGLLKLADESYIDAPEFKDLFDIDIVTQNESVIVGGYFGRSDDPFVNGKGYVAMPRSKTHFIPNLKYVMELLGTYGEYGMSGGRVARKGNPNKIIGTISHQYLEHIEGNESEVREYEKTTTSDPASRELNHLIIIPAERTRNWLLRYFESPDKFKPSFVRDPDLQLYKVPAFFSNGLMFKMVEPPKVAAPAVVPAEPAKTDDVKNRRGGGEGIGGPRPRQNPVWITIEKDVKTHNASWNLEARAEWIEKAAQVLELPDTKLEIRTLVDRHNGDLERVQFQNLSDFFMQLSNENVSAPTVVPERFGRKKEAATIAKLQDLGKQLVERVQAVKPKNESAATDRLLERIKMIGEFLITDWEVLESTDIQKVLPPEKDSPEWDHLLVDFGKDSSEILRLLMKAQVELENITL